jgi:nucleosome assembly protein 1-like 1
VEVKKQRHKATNKTRTVKKTTNVPTFFSFFNPPKPLGEDEDEDEDEENEDGV